MSFYKLIFATLVFNAKGFSLRTFGLIVVAALLSACDGHSGSGEANQANPNTNLTAGVFSNYSGPTPQTSDIQNFKLSLWDNLVNDGRCGDCHNEEVGQNPQFVRRDDINLAYQAASGVVNLSNPSDSRMVVKVSGGHNCWEASADVCADIITKYIEDWAGSSGLTIPKSVQLTAPTTLKDAGSSKNFTVDSASFETTVYPLLRDNCAGCHAETAAIQQSPFFASADLETAYDAAQSKIDLATPANSRFVVRLRNEFHNCWSDCSSNSTEMEQAIQALSDTIEVTEIDPDLVLSKAMNLVDGIAAKKGVRYKANAIAMYEFKTGLGSVAYDTSGVDPAIHLTLSGDVEWLGSWGLRVNDGKAQGTTTASKKLFDLIRATSEYSIEAWVTPANVTQEEARIVSYSGGTTARNFTLGQTLYNYDFFNRSTTTDGNGDPALSTEDDEEVLQAALQHVVASYDPVNGRRLYVNGELIETTDPVEGGLLSEWDDTFALVVGNEVSSDRLWQGSIRYLAIHNRILSETQVEQNFEAGVGEIFYVLFSLADVEGVSDNSYVVFEVSQYDSSSYLFNSPRFVILNDSSATDFEGTVADIQIQGMRIGLNGREVEVGQAFANLDITVSDANYNKLENFGATLISQYVPGLSEDEEFGTIIPLEKGSDLDEFFLTFERLGDANNVYVEAEPTATAQSFGEDDQSYIGIRTFEEINVTMSAMTGVSVTQGDVAETYATIKQQLPTVEDIDGFLASQQMAVTQLAIEYCNALVESSTLRANYFSGFNFAANPDSALDASGRQVMFDSLLENMMGNNLSVQPDVSAVESELNGLIDLLNQCPQDCNANRTETIVKASCAAVLGSAVMLIQ